MNLDHDSFDGASEITPSVAVRLFSAMLGPNAQPIDRLVARCVAIDGLAWSTALLATRGPRPRTIEGWMAWKSLAKSSIHEGELHAGEQEALGSFLCYLVAIAGALALDGTLITRISRLEIRRGLITVGGTLDPTGRELFEVARKRLDAMGASSEQP